MAQQKLVFVHQHSTTSIRDKELQVAEVRSHIARLIHDRRRLTKPALFSRRGTSTHLNLYLSKAVAKKHTTNVEHRDARADPTGHTSKEKANNSSNLWEQLSCPSPSTLMQHGNSDPFSASAVQITPQNHSLIATWQTIFVQTVIPSEIQKSSTSLTVWNTEGIDMIECAERLHFVLAWTTLLQSTTMPTLQMKKQLMLEALSHKAAGIVTLRKNLPTLARLTAIRAVWHLMGAELYSGYLTAALTHFHAMVDLVVSGGGLDSLPWELKKLVIVSDMTMSAARKTKPTFKVDEWDPGSVTTVLSESETVLLAIDVSKQQPVSEMVPPRLVHIIEAYRELLAVYRIVADMTDTSRLTDLLLWAHLRQYALTTRVTDIKATIDELPESASGVDVERALCVAIDYFSQILWIKNNPQRTVLAPFRHLEHSFETLQRAAEFEPSSPTLWIVFVGATVELVLRRRGHGGRYFAARFTAMTTSLALKSAEQVRQSLSCFLYQATTFDHYLNILMSPTQQVEGGVPVHLIQMGSFAPKPPPQDSGLVDVFKQTLTISFGPNQGQESVTVQLEDIS
ncbi:hypothetical protein CLAIMM_09555 [Cladophialophora immunda]|nr:hypothetical protein CLAIMM_09555 [Cladophialophora immunda]